MLFNSGLDKPLAAIFGCASSELTSEEAEFFRECKPTGFILFDRNIETVPQVQKLVKQLKDVVGRMETPILIDQEGGRVARLRPPNWLERPAASYFGEIARSNIEVACKAVAENARQIGQDLFRLGISVNCGPVLDLAIKGSDGSIGDRAFSNDPVVVSKLGRAYVEGISSSGIVPVLKHIPGHGRALVDSHYELPHVLDSYSTLCGNDFLPFRELSCSPLAMTAHVAYNAIDKTVPATFSKIIIGEIIREEIGFKGLLLSDDISMGALVEICPEICERTTMTLNAGCDLILHCNADILEMKLIADVCGNIGTDTLNLLTGALRIAANKRSSLVKNKG